MVEFFKTSIACKAIKYLLSQTALPLYKTITSDEYIIAGCKYIYKDKLIECTKSGRFQGINSSLIYDDHLYANDHITVSDDYDYVKVRGHERIKEGDLDITDVSHLDIEPANPKGIGPLVPKIYNEYYDDYITVTDDVVKQYLRPFAEIRLIEDYEFGQFIPGLSQYHISNSNYYDTDTHYYLGEYLRCLRDIKGIDLMSLYNCYTYKYVNNVYIDPSIENSYLSDTLPDNKKLTLIPIKFNKTYTIATNCSFKINMKSVLYKDELMKDLNRKSYITEKLNESYRIVNNLNFLKPITYSIQVEDPNLLQYEKYLYLAIQLPYTHDAPIVVLEGDYTEHSDKHISDVASINLVSDQQLSRMFRGDVSLLNNDGIQKPFANVLLEYLFENTIDSRETIDNNIKTIEEKVKYYPEYPGQWGNTLRYILYRKYMDCQKHNLDKQDVLGFIDSKMESAIHKGWIVNGK